MRIDVENSELRMRLAIAWGWMIAKGADEESLRAVGALDALAQKITVQQFDAEEYMKEAIRQKGPDGF